MRCDVVNSDRLFKIVATKQKHGGKRAGAGRPTGYIAPPVVRERIRTGMLIDVLEKISDGTIKKFNPARVTAATALLRKVLPDLAATDITSGNKPIVMERRVFKRPPVDSVANGKQETKAEDTSEEA